MNDVFAQIAQVLGVQQMHSSTQPASRRDQAATSETQTVNLLRELQRHPWQSARELCASVQLAGDSATVSALLRRYVVAGVVLQDRTEKRVRYALETCPNKLQALREEKRPSRRRGVAPTLRLVSSEMLEWHNVQDALPEDDGTVLAWGEGDFFCAHIGKQGGWVDCVDGMPRDDVTHWARPEGPPALALRRSN